MKIRSHLLLLAAGAMIPLLAFAVLVSVVLLERDRATVQRAASDRARAMMTAVDAELRGSVATLDAVGASAALAAGDLRAFHGEAARVLGSQPQWLEITLVTPAGEKLLEVSLKPKKTNITVRLVALVWAPHWRLGQQTAPAWE